MPRLETQKVPPVNSAGASFLFLRAFAERFGLGRDRKNAFQMGVADHGRDQAVLDRHGECDMGGAVMTDLIVFPRAVDRRDPAQRLGRRFQNKIVHRELHTLFFQGGVELGAQFEKRACIDLDVDVEVRNHALGFHEALGDRRPHVRDRNDLVFLDRATGEQTEACRRQGFGAGWRHRAGGASRCCQNIGAHNAPTRTAAGDLAGIDAFFRRELAGERGDLDAAAGGIGGRRTEDGGRRFCR